MIRIKVGPRFRRKIASLHRRQHQENDQHESHIDLRLNEDPHRYRLYEQFRAAVQHDSGRIHAPRPRSYPGSGKSIVTSLSPLTGAVIDSNVGGYFGPYLKFSGFDALKITGKSDQDLVLMVDGIDGHIAIYEAEGLAWDSYELSQQLTEHLAKVEGWNTVKHFTDLARLLRGLMDMSM